VVKSSITAIKYSVVKTSERKVENSSLIELFLTK
jgi:hypothetical protein